MTQGSPLFGLPLFPEFFLQNAEYIAAGAIFRRLAALSQAFPLYSPRFVQYT